MVVGEGKRSSLVPTGKSSLKVRLFTSCFKTSGSFPPDWLFLSLQGISISSSSLRVSAAEAIDSVVTEDHNQEERLARQTFECHHTNTVGVTVGWLLVLSFVWNLVFSGARLASHS